VVRAALVGARTAERRGRAAVHGMHPAGYGADGGDAWPGEPSRSLKVWAHGEGARLGRLAGADAEAASTQARRAGACDVAARRRSGPTACRCALV
jgi:hypothetical protein